MRASSSIDSNVIGQLEVDPSSKADHAEQQVFRSDRSGVRGRLLQRQLEGRERAGCEPPLAVARESHMGMGINDSDWLTFRGHLEATLGGFDVPAAERADVLGFRDSRKGDIVD